MTPTELAIIGIVFSILCALSSVIIMPIVYKISYKRAFDRELKRLREQ